MVEEVVVCYSIQLWHVQNCIQLIFATDIATMIKVEKIKKKTINQHRIKIGKARDRLTAGI